MAARVEEAYLLKKVVGFVLEARHCEDTRRAEVSERDVTRAHV